MAAASISEGSRVIVQQAVRAHLRGEYGLAIPVLLPLVDGLANDILVRHPHLVRPKTDKKGKPKNKLSLGDRVGDVAFVYDAQGRARTWADAVVSVVEGHVFKSYDFTGGAPPSKLNRHGVLHGRIADYASQVNSLRAFLLVDVMVQVSLKLHTP